MSGARTIASRMRSRVRSLSASSVDEAGPDAVFSHASQSRHGAAGNEAALELMALLLFGLMRETTALAPAGVLLESRTIALPPDGTQIARGPPDDPGAAHPQEPPRRTRSSWARYKRSGRMDCDTTPPLTQPLAQRHEGFAATQDSEADHGEARHGEARHGHAPLAGA